MLGNWVRCTTTTTGTGNLTLSSVSGYPDFNAVFGVGAYCYYAILNDSDGTPIEIGIGHLSASTTLVRDKVIATYVSGTYDDTAPSAVSLAAGTKRVVCTPEASAFGAPVTDIMSGISGDYDRRGFGPAAHSATYSSGAAVKDRCYYVPIQVTANVTIAKLSATNGATAGTGGTNGFRLGLYNSLPTGGPGAKLFESGNLASSAYAELVYTLATPVRLPPGWYYGAVCNDYATVAPTIYSSLNSGASNGCSAQTPLGWYTGNGAGQRIIGLYQALTGGWSSLPSSASVTPSLLASGDSAPYIFAMLE